MLSHSYKVSEVVVTGIALNTLQPTFLHTLENDPGLLAHTRPEAEIL